MEIYSLTRSVDITTDLVAGDVDIRAKREAGGANAGKWNLRPKAILIVTAVDSIEDIVLKTHVDNQEQTMKLKSNVIQPIAAGVVVKAGTTTEQIIIFGD